TARVRSVITSLLEDILCSARLPVLSTSLSPSPTLTSLPVHSIVKTMTLMRTILALSFVTFALAVPVPPLPVPAVQGDPAVQDDPAVQGRPAVQGLPGLRSHPGASGLNQLSSTPPKHGTAAKHVPGALLPLLNVLGTSVPSGAIAPAVPGPEPIPGVL
ncbi:hypothetical protein EDB84DRAFT_1658710, partial [Lactarius hengduanensis]